MHRYGKVKPPVFHCALRERIVELEGCTQRSVEVLENVRSN